MFGKTYNIAVFNSVFFMFNPVDNRQNFSKLEEQMLQFWQENDSFRKSIDIRSGEEEFVFYDGPPFATGLPHYGHILAGTIKDVIPRYKTMRGFRVERKFGWDCHGLPVENLIEKELGLEDKQAILEYGIDNFNEACRNSVLRYTSEWEETVSRMGRWVDFKNDYKTMDPEFMESIWWVFKQLWNKNKVYQGLKPMHICPRCVTPLSNFEVNQGYADLTDLSVTAKFAIKGQENTYMLAWTTTPWTLPGNMLLAVNPEVTYLLLGNQATGEKFYIAESENDSILKDYKIKLAQAVYEGEEEKVEWALLKRVKGADLAGLEYEPLFAYYQDASSFKVVAADFVTTDSGTGIVHIAPAFGEDDLQVGKKEGLQAIQHVGMDGMYEAGLVESIQAKFSDFKNIPVKQNGDNKNRLFDEQMVAFLEQEGKVFEKKMLRHSYPTCWRCDTPLLNYATKSWFVKVEEMKEDLLANNQKIHWVPDHLKNGRFGKWLEGGRDWAVSRNRYWGTPLPVWENDTTGKQICVGSVEELKELSGVELTDLHKHFTDKVEFSVEGEEGTYKRIEEVFDCWFESGSMPYAQRHYPFAENIEFKNEFFTARHGEGIHNTQDILSATLETAKAHTLTEKGEKEVQDYALNAKNKGIVFDVIVASPFERTTHTAKIYQEHCGGDLIIDERLREHNVGVFDGKPLDDWRAWAQSNDPEVTAPQGGENWQDVMKRMSEILNEYNDKYEGKKILFVSHSCPLELLQAYVQCKPSREKGNVLPTGKLLPLQNIKFPADFIAEGLDQTRGWFYTLHVLGTAIFDKPAFSNVITNGIILAKDGQKMSKSKKNYPDPSLIFDDYGADAMRFYLMNSPVTQADDFRFDERGVSEVVRTVILPLWNSYSFFVTYANADGWTPSGERVESDNDLDKWILSELEILRSKYYETMELYHLNRAAEIFPKFIDNLTNWYIRRSRRRFWAKTGEGNDADKNAAYETLYFVLQELIQLLAPFCPFVTEAIYQNLHKDAGSIHHLLLKEVNESAINTDLSDRVGAVQNIISLGLQLRKNVKMKVRQPLAKVEVASAQSYNFSQEDLDTVKEELNVKEIVFLENPEELAELQVKPNARLLGPKFGKRVQEIIKEAKSGNFEKVEGGYIVCGENITEEEMEMAYVGKEGKEVASGNGVVVSFDLELTQDLINEGKARDIVRAIQDLRKQAEYDVSDRIILEVTGADDVMADFVDYITGETLSDLGTVSSADQEGEVDGVVIKIQK